MVNMKQSKWISLQHNGSASFIAQQSKDNVLAEVLFDDDEYPIETINLPHEMLQRLRVHLGFAHLEVLSMISSAYLLNLMCFQLFMGLSVFFS